MNTCKTTLETLIGAALGTDADTLGNNSGASYTCRFVFCNKYSFEAYCEDDNNIWITLCEVDGTTSKVLIGHCLTINHNELLAPIYARFLWADFEALLNNNASLSHIDKEDFAINLLNCREDDMSDRANSVVERVFATAIEYEKRGNVYYFMSSEYGPVYFNEDCFEYYINALQALPEDILAQVNKDLGGRAEWLKDNKSLSRLTGLTKSDILASANEAKVKLLDKVLEIIDPDGFAWALNTYRDIDNAAEDRLSKVHKYSASSNEAFKQCLENLKADAYNDAIETAEALANWQAQRGISFDMQTLALLFYELGLYNHLEFADELLRDSDICEVIAIAYIKPSNFK